MVKLFKLIGGHAIPRLDAVTTGWPVLAWGLGSAILAAVLAGLFPALRASRLDPIQVLKSAGPKSSAGRGERRLLRGVTMVQTALTLALLVGAGLLIRTMMNLSKVQSGYNTGQILTMSVTAVQGDWADFHRRALERVSALPRRAVRRVRLGSAPDRQQLAGDTWKSKGSPRPPKRATGSRCRCAASRRTTSSCWAWRSSDGRDFRSTDDRKAPRCRHRQPGAGGSLLSPWQSDRKKLWLGGRQRPATEIVGVVANGRTDDLTQAAAPEVYLSLWQASAFSKHLVVRTAADPRSVMAAVQRELHSVDPTAAVENLKTLEQIRGDSLASRTFAMQLLVGFSLVGSVLTLVGIYGVLSLSVASRRRELAIRTAVGAEQRDIRNLVFAEGFRLIAGGVLAGIGAAIVLSRVLKSFLFEVEPGDPATLIGVGLLFVSVALLACWVPVRRAARVDPLEALRYE